MPMGDLGRPSRSNSTNMSINYLTVSPTPSTCMSMGALRALGSPPRSRSIKSSNYLRDSP